VRGQNLKPDKSDKTIMLVDDNLAIRMNVKGLMEIGVERLLEIEGYTAGAKQNDVRSMKHSASGVKPTLHWEAVLTAIFVFTTMTPVAKAADILKATYAAKPAIPEYRLGPEDVIEVFVWKQPELTTTVVIRPDGRISLPLTNELEASGKTAIQLQKDITEKLREYITQPVVNVIVRQVNSLKISVLGEVRKPDVYKIKNQVTVLDAIAMAGGFTDLARTNRVIVIRNAQYGSQRIKINVKQVVADDGQAPFYLQPQDTVYVE
jgi:polysaccharide biosynthesis/export protein